MWYREKDLWYKVSSDFATTSGNSLNSSDTLYRLYICISKGYGE